MKRSKTSFAVFVLPAFVIYTIFMLLPLISSLGLSLFSWTGYGEKEFVGLSNFSRLFTENPFNVRFFNSLFNNMKFFIYTIILQNVAALVIALLLNKELTGSKFFRTVYFIPTTISVVIVGFLWTLIYNPLWGPLNYVLKSVGLEFLAKPWLGDPKFALLSIAVANAWQYVGIPMMLFLAGLQSISQDIYEASDIDGVSSWQKFFYITLPLISPVIFIITTLTFVGNFSAFEIIYAMEGTLAGPNYSTDILGTFFYRTSFGQRAGAPPDMGLGAAIASCMFAIIGLGVILWFNLYGKRENY
ncbi:MAG: sugar ABC transporter permease [Nitrospiraceae bacterium]|nr:MAG: sugar ABC transporter permease [Nitrospiraceae bacterium]